jgi:hypothetical protein
MSSTKFLSTFDALFNFFKASDIFYPNSANTILFIFIINKKLKNFAHHKLNKYIKYFSSLKVLELIEH